MPFSKSQQAFFRPIVDAAWKRAAAVAGIDPKNKDARRTWYEEHLERATGHRTTTDCGAGRPFERACAHFEELAENGIEAQRRLLDGDLRRIRFALQRTDPEFLRGTTDQDLHAWLRGIAKQATGAPDFPELWTLTDAQIATVTRAAVMQAKREKLCRTAGN